MKVRLTERAGRDLAEAHRFIALENLAAAEAVRSALHAAIVSLRSLPDRGAPLRRDMRRLVLPDLSYSVVYRVRGETVDVLTIRHHKRA